MRFEDQIELYLSDEMEAPDRATFEARLKDDPRAAARVEQERQLRSRLAGALDEGAMSGAERGEIWDQFLAKAGSAQPEPAAEPAPRIPGPGSTGFPWRIFALPAAAGLIAVVAWGAGLFDRGEVSPPKPVGDAQAEARFGDPGPTIFQQAPVIQAVFATDRKFRQARGSNQPDSEYPGRLRRALDGKSMVSVWFDEKKVTSRRVKIDEVERVMAECSTEKVSLPALPESAEIEACCVHELKLDDGQTMRIPHVLLCCGGKKLSAYFLCGSLRPMVEEAMKRCAKLVDTNLKDGAATKIHQCPECGIFAMPRGRHLMVLVSDLEPTVMDEVVELF